LRVVLAEIPRRGGEGGGGGGGVGGAGAVPPYSASLLGPAAQSKGVGVGAGASMVLRLTSRERAAALRCLAALLAATVAEAQKTTQTQGQGQTQTQGQKTQKQGQKQGQKEVQGTPLPPSESAFLALMVPVMIRLCCDANAQVRQLGLLYAERLSGLGSAKGSEGSASLTGGGCAESPLDLSLLGALATQTGAPISGLDIATLCSVLLLRSSSVSVHAITIKPILL
jgi:hypothetical protein